MAGRAIWAPGLGQGASYGSAGFTGSSFNSLASGSVVVAGTPIANGSIGDTHADLSISIVGTTGTGSQYFGVYALPLNQDSTTYGDGTATGTVLPAVTYYLGAIMVPISKTAAVLVGSVTKLEIPFDNFVWAISNMTSSALAAAAAASIEYRTYVLNLNG